MSAGVGSSRRSWSEVAVDETEGEGESVPMGGCAGTSRRGVAR